MSNEKRTLIEEGTELSGTLKSTCPVVVRGKVSGELTTPALTVSASGTVEGKAQIGSLVSEGRISGEFDADTVQLSGAVDDGTVLRAKTLEVKLAGDAQQQVSFGNSKIAAGGDPRQRQP